MPFTPAHAAAVLPFVRWNSRYVSATGLVVGSVVPDFEYFLKMSVDGVHGHTLWGILYFDVPLGVVLALIFHNVVKQNLIGNLPRALQERFCVVRAAPFNACLKKAPVVFLVSVAFGALTHIAWDNFTHGAGYFPTHFREVYRSLAVEAGGVYYPFWFVLQHASTVLGLMLIIWYVVRMKAVTGAQLFKPSARYWVVVVALTVVITAVRFLIYPADYNLGNVVVTMVSAGCMAVIAAGWMKPPARVRDKSIANE